MCSSVHDIAGEFGSGPPQQTENWRLGGVSSPLGRPPRNRETVSFRLCMRALWLSRGKTPQKLCVTFSLFHVVAWGFPFSLERSGEFHRVLVSSSEF